ncbi:hypothetical protein BDY24DRAFT_53446 [Mrakia frigida]|uniref:uncharacterized protein n=1 Tax=Mrakia frigida TaxID=29902 RepID=UPI003FCC0397
MVRSRLIKTWEGRKLTEPISGLPSTVSPFFSCQFSVSPPQAMNIPSTSTSTSTSTTSLDASQTSSSFLATVRNRLGGSSFALPSLLNDQDGSQQDSETRQDGQENEDDEEEDEDLEGMMWDAQKALISHNTPLAISLYSKALLLPPSSNPSPAAALALGNLLSRGPDDRHLQVGGGGAGATKSKMKKRREWETMNRAAGVYLVGLAGELERAGVVVVVVGKERERESRGGSSTTNGILVQKGGEVGSGKISNPAIALENAHELASHLLSLYRRGLVHPSDPPVPLPISPPHHPLLSPEQGDSKKNTNIWQLAQYLAGEALAADWNLKEQTMPLESPGRGEHSGSSARSEALKRSLKMHLHYLLALTSHATSPHESLDNFRTLLSLGPSNLKEATELLTSAQERVVSLEKRIASLELPPSQPPSPSVATLSPYSSTASTFGPSTATNGKGNGNGNGNGPLSRTTRTPATPFTLSPPTTSPPRPPPRRICEPTLARPPSCPSNLK